MKNPNSSSSMQVNEPFSQQIPGNREDDAQRREGRRSDGDQAIAVPGAQTVRRTGSTRENMLQWRVLADCCRSRN
jgi:hypothetical protein